MSKEKYSIIEHTADIGISITSNGLKSLFKNAALAMFDIIAQKKKRVSGAAGRKTLEIDLSAQDKEELFINWLNELLSLSATKGIIFSDIKINRLTENRVEAEVSGWNSAAFTLKKEIKAATYHGLRIGKKGRLLYAEVIFDV